VRRLLIGSQPAAIATVTRARRPEARVVAALCRSPEAQSAQADLLLH
jgi:hypothetical protein